MQPKHSNAFDGDDEHPHPNDKQRSFQEKVASSIELVLTPGSFLLVYGLCVHFPQTNLKSEQSARHSSLLLRRMLGGLVLSVPVDSSLKGVAIQPGGVHH